MNNELYHHGVLGQKWGVRNGPPYPLSSSSHSSSEKKAGWRKSLNAGKTTAKKKKKSPPKADVKARISKAIEEKKKGQQKIKEREDLIKNRRSLSDSDIKQMINRLQDEKRLKDLAEQDINPGKYAVKKVLYEAGMEVGKATAIAVGKYAVRKVVGDDVSIRDIGAYLAPGDKKKKSISVQNGNSNSNDAGKLKLKTDKSGNSPSNNKKQNPKPKSINDKLSDFDRRLARFK